MHGYINNCCVSLAKFFQLSTNLVNKLLFTMDGFVVNSILGIHFNFFETSFDVAKVNFNLNLRSSCLSLSSESWDYNFQPTNCCRLFLKVNSRSFLHDSVDLQFNASAYFEIHLNLFT